MMVEREAWRNRRPLLCAMAVVVSVSSSSIQVTALGGFDRDSPGSADGFAVRCHRELGPGKPASCRSAACHPAHSWDLRLQCWPMPRSPSGVEEAGLVTINTLVDFDCSYKCLECASWNLLHCFQINQKILSLIEYRPWLDPG